MPVSSPLWQPSSHSARMQHAGWPPVPHAPLSAFLTHPAGLSHRLNGSPHDPPQSTPVSSPFCSSSTHVGQSSHEPSQSTSTSSPCHGTAKQYAEVKIEAMAV